MRYILLMVIFSPIGVFAQKLEDSKIIVTLADSIGIYKKVKIALVNSDFIVKDNYNVDTLTTYAREFTTMSGNCVAIAIIKEKTVTISGYYSLKKIDWFGYTQSSNKFQNIIYFKGSQSWNLLMKVAEGLGGQITFSK